MSVRIVELQIGVIPNEVRNPENSRKVNAAIALEILYGLHRMKAERQCVSTYP